MNRKSKHSIAASAVNACVLSTLLACTGTNPQPGQESHPGKEQISALPKTLVALVLPSAIPDSNEQKIIWPRISVSGELTISTFPVTELYDASISMGSPALGFKVSNGDAFDEFIAAAAGNQVALILDEYFYSVTSFYSVTHGAGFLYAHGYWNRSPWSKVVSERHSVTIQGSGLPIQGNEPF